MKFLKGLSLSISFICFLVLTLNAQQSVKPYKNAKLAIPIRVKDLISRMTLEEKIGQLNVLLGWEMYDKKETISPSDKFKDAIQKQHIGMLWATLRADPWTKKTLENGLDPYSASLATNALQKWNLENSRLQIPLFFAEECPHGHMAIGATVFPTAIGQGSTWNPELIQQMGSVIAKETRLQGGHIGYGPVIDLARELRWSRVEETYGEDTYLTSKMGVAMVQGFQNNNLKSGENIMATLKHFIAYGVPEGGHNGGFVNLGKRELLQSYLPPFKAAVKADVSSIMTAYNSIDGVPNSSNSALLKTLLRNQWGFKGLVVSDLYSINGLRDIDHLAPTYTEAAALAMNAGIDADLGAVVFSEPLIAAVKSGMVKIERIDEAVTRVLTKKFEMGLFENPYTDPALARTMVNNAAAIKLARQVASESIILLKNQNQLLPLSKQLKSIAVIGPNADNLYNQLGDYTATQKRENIVTVLDGIKNKFPKDVIINYVKGCGIRDTNNTNIDEAVLAAQQAEVTVIVLGGSSARDFKTSYLETGAAAIDQKNKSDIESGEGFDRESLDLMGKQLALLKAVIKTGKPVVLVLIQGRPLNINWPVENVPAIINAWYPGMQGGNAIADVLFGDYNPAGRLPVSVPKSVGQLPVYYSFQNSSRHDYVEGTAKPLFPFGYGLSYTNFSYADLKVSKAEDKDQLSVMVTFKVKNTGHRDGDEVVQLYVKDEISSVVVPNKLLKQFKRIHLKAGEEKTIQFKLPADDFGLFNSDNQQVAEKGNFQLLIGGSSDHLELKGTVTLSADRLIK
ncbi:glycoside hydrolase family 3 N-terminal domain-containing protein [Pedobacter sp. N23S346]|uniref:glycoside hydrolase family 3 N-terminal domain-containing protein n=1 Tax=Pedobacter sp. N23S346 TaxID=3402750 RepID=UPI003AC02D5D